MTKSSHKCVHTSDTLSCRSVESNTQHVFSEEVCALHRVAISRKETWRFSITGTHGDQKLTQQVSCILDTSVLVHLECYSDGNSST